MSKKHSHSDLAELLMDVVPKVMQSIREEMRHGRGELSVPQFRLLAAINRGICNNKILGERLGVSEAAISRMIDLLVQEKLVKKTISKEDRRNKVLSLTLEGEKLYSAIRSEARVKMKAKLEKLDKNDVEIIIKGLEILQNNNNIFEG